MPHCPMKFRYVRRWLTSAPVHILDIGCGNNSPSVTKRWFPGCHYTGADIQRYNLGEADDAAMDAFYLLGADGSGYDAIPDDSYDLVILNHVLEHMTRASARSGRALPQDEARRLHMDRLSIPAQFESAFVGR